MRKRLIATLILILITLLGGMLYVLYTFFSAPRTPVKVGIYYYVWYTDGNGTYHWNGNKNWTVVDIPILDFYNSTDEDVIKKHLDWFKYAGIDFGIISWWGPNRYEDNATKQVFNVTKNYAPWMKWTIMVEGFNESYGPESYNFPAIFDYIYNTYVVPYRDNWLELNGKPLLCWYNAWNMTGAVNGNGQLVGGWSNIPKIYNDTRFESRILGHNSYVDWYFCTPCSVDNSTAPKLCVDGFIAVEPRYDDKYLGRDKNSAYDERLEYLYWLQWNKVLMHRQNGEVNLVVIYSWNEYHERSQIEPCNDTTSVHADNPYFLLNKTKEYVEKLRAMPEFPLNTILPLSSAIIIVSAAIVYEGKH
jgi:hypothetical protein